MKRIVILLTVLACMFALSCGGGGGGSHDDNNDAATWPVEFYGAVGGVQASSMRVAPATGIYKYIYFYANGTYKSGDVNNGALSETGSGTYSGGDPHGNATLNLIGTFGGVTLNGEAVEISSGLITIAGVSFARADGNGGYNNVVNYDDTTPLCFTAKEAGSTVKLDVAEWGGPAVLPSVYTSTDGTNWTAYTMGNVITLEKEGDKVYFRGDNNTFSDDVGNMTFVMTGKIDGSGNIMSLLDTTLQSKTIPCDYCFEALFFNCQKLRRAPALPATTLKEGCYSQMFCYTRLKTAPALPATTLADVCYESMFTWCYRLLTAPVLPATALAECCYDGMFENCTSLTAAPALPATTMAVECYKNMFVGCTSLATAPVLPAKTLAVGCYEDMFNGCTSLTTAPVLPATTLAESCYDDMFEGCTSLTKAPVLPATALAAGCYSGMFEDCTGLTTAPVLPATTLADYCYSGMFTGCIGLTTAPTLPATTLADFCYNEMFNDCTSLNYIKVSFDSWDEFAGSTNNWVPNVSNTGTFICPAALVDPYAEYGESRIPTGWTVNP